MSDKTKRPECYGACLGGTDNIEKHGTPIQSLAELAAPELNKDTKIGVFYYVYKENGFDVPGTDFITFGMLAKQAQEDLNAGFELRTRREQQ